MSSFLGLCWTWCNISTISPLLCGSMSLRIKAPPPSFHSPSHSSAVSLWLQIPQTAIWQMVMTHTEAKKILNTHTDTHHIQQLTFDLCLSLCWASLCQTEDNIQLNIKNTSLWLHCQLSCFINAWKPGFKYLWRIAPYCFSLVSFRRV